MFTDFFNSIYVDFKKIKKFEESVSNAPASYCILCLLNMVVLKDWAFSFLSAV